MEIINGAHSLNSFAGMENGLNSAANDLPVAHPNIFFFIYGYCYWQRFLQLAVNRSLKRIFLCYSTVGFAYDICRLFLIYLKLNLGKTIYLDHMATKRAQSRVANLGLFLFEKTTFLTDFLFSNFYFI